MLREILRAETFACHQSIERKFALSELAQSKTAYASLLERCYGFYLPIEANLANFADELRENSFELKPRLKSGWIAEDLLKLGYNPERLSETPMCTSIPCLSEYGSVLGCLYVLEGSTLGGQVISRHFTQTLSITRENGGRFFDGYGSRTGTMWRSFLEFLNEQGARAGDQRTIVNAACNTFRSLEEWMFP